MHSLFEERMPSQEISSLTMVSLTRVLVKNRFVEVAPIVFKLFRAFMLVVPSDAYTILKLPIEDCLLNLTDEFGSLL